MKIRLRANFEKVQILIVALFLASLRLGGAQAQTAPDLSRAEARAVMQICRNDIKAYCGDVALGEGRLAACLRANGERLSQPCRDKLVELLNR